MVMKQPTLIRSAVLAGSALIAGLAFAGDEAPPAAPSSGLDVELGFGYSSEYIFRSINFGDDLFHASIGLSGSGSLPILGDVDLSAGLDLRTASVNAAVSDTANNTVSGQEMRISAAATKALGSFDLTVGVTNYSYFGTAGAGSSDVMEPYIALSTELAGLNVGIGVYDQDWFAVSDPYIEITAGRSIDLGGLGLCVKGVIGSWNEFDDTHYGICVGLPIDASDSITVTPHVSAVFGDTLTGDDEFSAGVNLGFGF